MQDRLIRTLAVLGPSPARTLMAELQISQSTLSRLVQGMRDAVVVGGRARATRYGARRQILGVVAPIPVYDVAPSGKVRFFSRLYPVEPAGFWQEPAHPRAVAAWCPDLPWFLQDARPAGFLGRLEPRRHPELGLPLDIRSWSTDQVLRFLTREGSDVVGAFIVGDDAYQRFRQRASDLAGERLVDDSDYPRLAETVLSSGQAGSSAAGEQPKFLTTRASDDGARAVLVKFSPPGGEVVGRRVADLLVCEHLALKTLQAAGVPASSSRIFVAADGVGRTFLEVERFDRLGAGRRGLVSLASLDAQFVGGEHRRWPQSTQLLLRQGIISADDHRHVRFLDLFGGLIGNNDMHFGNVSFFLDGADVGGLAPIYDMLPTRYAPVAGEIVSRAVELVLPTPQDADLAEGVVAAARSFWQAVVDDERIGAGVSDIARAHLSRLARL